MKEQKRSKKQMAERATVFDGFGLGEQTLKEREELLAKEAKGNDSDEKFAEGEDKPARPVRKRSAAGMRARAEAPEWFGVADGPEELAKFRAEMAKKENAAD